MSRSKRRARSKEPGASSTPVPADGLAHGWIDFLPRFRPASAELAGEALCATWRWTVGTRSAALTAALVISLQLAGAAALLSLAVIAVPLGRTKAARAMVYGACADVCLRAAGLSLHGLLAAGPPEQAVLPLGVPWVGARFRLDALTAAFLVVVDLGGALASL
jgi:hypothetical protein